MRVRLRHDQLQKILALSPFSQNHWALKLGFSRGHWSEIVNGKHPYPSPRTRERMLEILGVPHDQLFAIEEGEPSGDELDFRVAISGRYSLLGELGHGGMGTVYLAMDRRQGRQVALKVVNPEAVGGIGAPELMKEIALVARLHHPNILPLLDSGEDAGHPWFAMPLARGGSLRDRLRSRGGRLPLSEALPLVRGIAAALDHAHGERILHCDVKPENVLLHDAHAWVVDFGIARKLHTEADEWRPLRKELDFSAGTPAYVSPEQADGSENLDPRSDVYSLACVVYEMLTGHTPFEGTTTREIVTRRFRAPAPDLLAWAPEVPRAVAEVIARGMAFDRDQRPATATEFAVALERAAAGESRFHRIHFGLEQSLMRSRRLAGLEPNQKVGRFLTGAGKDITHALRSLRRTPAIAIAAVACLALGLGATTAIFSAVYTALMRPLPLAEPERLVAIFRTTPHFDTGPFSTATFLDLARAPRSLEGVAAIAPAGALLEGTGDARRVGAFRVSDNLFQLLGVGAVQGRLFRPGDGETAARDVALLSEELWRTQFGSDEALLGGTLRINGVVHTVLGIVPAGFRLPHGSQSLQSDVWTTLRFSPDQATQRRNNFMWLVGRLRPGVTVSAADAELRTQMDGIIAAHPEIRGEQLKVVLLHRDSTRTVRRPLLLLLGAVGFVLLIAIGNVASLLLARGVEQQREIAVRTALGASPAVVIRRALLESSLLAGTGLILGVILAGIGVQLIGKVAAARLPQLIGLGLDGRVLTAAGILAALVALGCGIAPAWRAARTDPQDALRSGTRTGTGLEHHRFLRGLVTAEVALSLILLLGGGLVLRGFLRLTSEDPGFDPRTLLTLYVNISPERYGEAGPVERFLEPTLESIRRIPGVTEAGAISMIPYDGWGNNSNVRYEGQPDTDPTTQPLVEYRVVTPGYFRAMGQSLLRGRLLEPTDDQREESPAVVVINRALAVRDFPGQDPIGKRFHLSDSTFGTIIGEVSDIKNAGPSRPPHPEMYWSYRQSGRQSTGFPLLVRTAGDPNTVARQVTAAIRTADPGAAVSAVRPMTEVISDSVGQPRFYLLLLGVFAGVALLLAMAGLYGTMNYAVARRTRELGIRMALGGTPSQTMRLVLGQGLVLISIGSLLGLVGAVSLTRLLTGLLYGVSPLDPVTWVLVLLGLGSVAVVAMLIPARRAAGVDPVTAIRQD